MTTMVRKTVAIPPALDQAIVDLRRTDKYCRASYSDIVRDLLLGGLDTQSVTHTQAQA